jgi:16S rRNA (uracil1498-N3)-methyltransferase
MKHIFRFLGEIIPEENQSIVEQSEHHHLSKVLRLRLGDEIEVFNGLGSFALCKITEISKQKTKAAISKTTVHSRPKPLELLLSALKPATFEDILPSLIELGVTKIDIFRGNHTAKKTLHSKFIDRWQRISITACKQSKQYWLPEIQIHSDLEAALSHLTSKDVAADKPRFILDPDADETLISQLIGTRHLESPLITIGSESGLSSDESEYLKSHGFKPVTMGQNILRAQTAAVAAAALAAALTG